MQQQIIIEGKSDDLSEQEKDLESQISEREK